MTAPRPRRARPPAVRTTRPEVTVAQIEAALRASRPGALELHARLRSAFELPVAAQWALIR